MDRLSKAFRLLFQGFVLFSMLGLSGQERYVELESFLNARSSSSFGAQDRNVRAVVEKGTRGELLRTQRLSSGNLALQVKILQGPRRGQTFWFHYDVKNPALRLYDQAPAHWQVSARPGQAVAETRRDQTVYRDQAPSRVETGVTEQLDRVNQRVKNFGSPDLSGGCSHCTPVAGQGSDFLSRLLSERETGVPNSRRMTSACQRLVKPDGSLGDRGRILYSILNESRYRDSFLRPNALGVYCPRFNTLRSDEEKLKAWVWFWTVLGQRESDCELTKDHPTHYVDRSGRTRVLNPNRGYGIWAAERDANLRKRRGQACGNIADFSGQARCAVDTMMKTQLSRGQTASDSDLKYWGPTYNKRRGELAPQLRRFSACF